MKSRVLSLREGVTERFLEEKKRGMWLQNSATCGGKHFYIESSGGVLE